MNDIISQDELSLREERARKKLEVRARLEAQSKSPQKKGFMTPERKKKLRNLLRRKAAEELKRQQEVEAQKRRTEIDKRCGPKYNFEPMSAEELRAICKKMHERLAHIEDSKWDIENEVKRKDLDVREVASQVSDMRGKFVKPTLRRVPKYNQKIERMLLNARKEVGFCIPQLKQVEKKQFKVDEPKDSKDSAPEWSWKKGDAQVKKDLSQSNQQHQNDTQKRQSIASSGAPKKATLTNEEDELSEESTDEEEETLDAV